MTCVMVIGLLLFPFIFVMVAESRVIKNGCDVDIWDYETEPTKRIEPLCSSGNVYWYFPNRRLDIPFGLGLTQFVNRSTDLCFQFHVKAAHLTVSLDEAGRRRRPLLQLKNDAGLLLSKETTTTTTSSKEICLSSINEEKLPVLNLLVENGLTTKLHGRVHLEYDIREKRSDECVPCTETELFDSVCSHDIVLITKIIDVNDHLDRSRIKLAPIQVVRNRENLLERKGNVVEINSKCRFLSGHDRYLLTAGRRLGTARIGCVTKWNRFSKIWRELERKKENLCSIKEFHIVR